PVAGVRRLAVQSAWVEYRAGVAVECGNTREPAAIVRTPPHPLATDHRLGVAAGLAATPAFPHSTCFRARCGNDLAAMTATVRRSLRAGVRQRTRTPNDVC